MARKNKTDKRSLFIRIVCLILAILMAGSVLTVAIYALAS